jgi:protein TonB
VPGLKLLSNVPAVYPPTAKSARVQGTVGCEVVIDEEGAVVAARVVQSIPLLDQAALDAVKQYKFSPARPNGVTTPVVVTVLINFSLQ